MHLNTYLFEFLLSQKKLLYNHLIHFQWSDVTKKTTKKRCGICNLTVGQYLDYHSERCIDTVSGHCRRCGLVLEKAKEKEGRSGQQLADHETHCKNSKTNIKCGECDEVFVRENLEDARNARRCHMEQNHGYTYCELCYSPVFEKDICYATKENYIHHRALRHNITTLVCHCEMKFTCQGRVE